MKTLQNLVKSVKRHFFIKKYSQAVTKVSEAMLTAMLNITDAVSKDKETAVALDAIINDIKLLVEGHKDHLVKIKEVLEVSVTKETLKYNKTLERAVKPIIPVIAKIAKDLK